MPSQTTRSTSSHTERASPRARNKAAVARHGAEGCCDKHVLAPLRMLPEYKGAKQQRCVICNHHCSWYCVGCSTDGVIVPLHPPMTGAGGERKYSCLDVHIKNPGYFPKGVSIVSGAPPKKRKAASVAHYNI